MNLSQQQIEGFYADIQKVLSGEMPSATIEFEGVPEEMFSLVFKKFGETKVRQELFFLYTKQDKKDWPEQKADIITSMKVVRSENRLKA